MNLELPVETVTPGPEWATDVNTAFEAVDEHDHTVGKGVKIPSAGINIDASLEFNSQKAIELKSTQYNSQLTPLSGVAESNSVQIVNGDLWIVNGSGTAVQVTSGTSVVAPSSSNTPAGIVLPYAGSSAPAGYLFADGSDISRTTYATLFGAIGVVFGPGDGSTTFTLPNLNGRAPIGTGTYTDPVSGSITRSLGEVLGAEKHVLTEAELASHTHGITDPGHTHPQGYAAGGSGFNATPAVNGDNGFNQAATRTASSVTGVIAQSTGGNTAHNNMQPSLGLNYIIKT
jgi:microcystin-dependent protein